MSAGRRFQFMRKKLGLVLLFSALLSCVAPGARETPVAAAAVAALSGELKKGFMTFLTFMPLRSQNTLPDLPQPSSGQMAGVSNGTLLVAGGSYFKTSIFEGGQKLWLDTILALEPNGETWRLAGRLD